MSATVGRRRHIFRAAQRSLLPGRVNMVQNTVLVGTPQQMATMWYSGKSLPLHFSLFWNQTRDGAWTGLQKLKPKRLVTPTALDWRNCVGSSHVCQCRKHLTPLHSVFDTQMLETTHFVKGICRSIERKASKCHGISLSLRFNASLDGHCVLSWLLPKVITLMPAGESVIMTMHWKPGTK